MQKKSNRFFTEEESRKSTRRWIYLITCWILIFVFIAFGGHTGEEDDGIPMKKLGKDGVKLNMTSGMAVRTDNQDVNPGDTEFSIEQVVSNDDPSRDGEEIEQPSLDEVLEAIDELKESEETNDEIPAEEEIVIEDGDAGTVIEAVEIGGSEEVDPTVETAAGDVVLSSNIDWSISD